MGELEINREAFKQAEKELLDNKVKEVKGYILETLEKTESKKREKERIEEELRILKLDLDDLRKGNFDKIVERKEKSKVAREVSVTLQPSFNNLFNSSFGVSTSNGSCLTGSLGAQSVTCSNLYSNADWQLYTSGTYPLSDGSVFYFGGSN